MARQIVNIGSTANDGTGDTVRDAFDKSNDNFLELYNRPYVIGFFAGGAFDAGEVFFKHVIKEDATFRFYDANGQTPVNGTPPATGTEPEFTVEEDDPSTERVFSITVEGVEVGTVTFAATSTVGVPEFDGGYFEAGVGDAIRVVAPNPVGTAIQGLSVTLLGFRS